MKKKQTGWRPPRREGELARVIKFPTPEERADRDFERHVQQAIDLGNSWRNPPQN